jgi:tetratricopeptide (TPR) repeat protein
VGLGNLLSEQLKILAAAAGDPARLALATVDLAHASLTERQRQALKSALQAAAVPHWVDEALLGAMLAESREESTQLLARLRALRVLEPFPARGQGAVNVHQASRLALRESVRKEQPERFAALSARAREALLPKNNAAHRVEALYHFFAVDQDAAATEWEDIDREIIHPIDRETMAAALDELRAAGWLKGAGKAVAILVRGFVCVDRGERTRLEEPAREAIALAQEAGRDALLGLAQCLLGQALSDKGQLEQAEAAYRSQLGIFVRLVHSDQKRRRWWRELAVAHAHVASVEELRGKLADALESMRQCLAIMERLAAQNPDDPDLTCQLAATHRRVASILYAQRLFPAALEDYRRALESYKRLTTRDPTNSEWQCDLADTHLKVGTVLHEQGDSAAAAVAFHTSLEIYKRVAEIDPYNTEVQRYKASPHGWLGRILREQGKHEEALHELEENLAIHQRLHAADPENVSLLRDLGIAHWSAAVAKSELGRKDEALKGFRTAEAQLQRAIEMAPGAPKWQHDLANIRSWIAYLGEAV